MRNITIAIVHLLLILAASPAAGESFIAATCTDYSTAGTLAVWEADAPWTVTGDVAAVHSDAVLGFCRGLLYVVNRLGGDNVQVLDPTGGFGTVRQFSVGAASGPQCILFDASGARALLPRQERDDVLVVNPETGAELAVIDLSGWADADGNAEVGQGVVIGGYAYVAICRLDRDFYWNPVGDSYLAVIDLESNSLVDVNAAQPGVQAIPLQAANPAGELAVGPDGMIYCSCVGFYGLQDGGIERVNPDTRASEGLAITESALGGDVNDFEIVDANTAYVVVSDIGYNTDFKRFNLATGGSIATIEAGMGYAYTDLEIDASGDLYLCDRTYGAEGLRVYDAATGALLQPTVSLGLGPYDIFVPSSATAVAETPAAAGDRLGVYPNPFNPTTTIAWSGLPAGRAALEVFDVRGRLIDTREIAAQDGGGRIMWEAGPAAAGGVYLARVTSGGVSATTRLVLLK